MRKLIILIMLCVSLLATGPVLATDDSMLRSDVPNQYEVVQGDTLWEIAARFLNEPWRWPEIWGLNRDQLKNPHIIYPGDTIVLEKTLKGNHLQLIKGQKNQKFVKLSPQIRIEDTKSGPIPSILASVIEPFLSQPLVVEKDGLSHAPYLLGTSDNRVILSRGNIVYIANMPDNLGKAWQIFRTGKALKDPDQNNQVMGYEAEYLGNASVKKFDEISTALITHSTHEILKGDRMIPAPGIIFNNYAPHAPDSQIYGRIVSVYGGVTEIGKGAIVTLSRGMLDGLEMGHVLAVYRRSQTRSPDGKMVELPDERTGLVFVFRVFDHVSYALVVKSTSAIRILDAVKNP